MLSLQLFSTTRSKPADTSDLQRCSPEPNQHFHQFLIQTILHPECWKFPDFEHLGQREGCTPDYRSLKRTASAKSQKQSCRRPIPTQLFLVTHFCHSWPTAERGLGPANPCSHDQLLSHLLPDAIGDALIVQGLPETDPFCLMTGNILTHMFP